MTGLKKMVKYLEERKNGWGMKDLFSEGHFKAYDSALDFARSLLAEEQSQAKPPCKSDSSFLCNELIAEQAQKPTAENVVWQVKVADDGSLGIEDDIYVDTSLKGKNIKLVLLEDKKEGV